MATLTLSLVTGGNTFTRGVTLSDADATRLRNAYATVYGLQAGTTQQIFNALAAGIFNEMKSLVIATETQQQQPTIPDLPMT